MGLTEAERAILDSLADAWNGFVRLGNDHPDDLTEFRQAIHSAQNLIAFRVARRVDPEVWALPSGSPVEDLEAEVLSLGKRVEKLEGSADDNPWGITGYDRD